MKVGIPRGLLYYEYDYMREEFFKELDIDYIVSPKTDKNIYESGVNHAMHESCLPLKVLLGHVDYLLDKCDTILVGRIGNLGYYDRMCTRYQASIDLVQNTFRDKGIKVLPFNVDYRAKDFELTSFVEMGKKLGKKRSESLRAYTKVKHAQKLLIKEREKKLEESLSSDKIKILLVGHKYNVYDDYSGSVIIDSLRKMGAEIIFATDMEGKKADFYSKELTDTMPWTFNRELLGAINKLRDKVDGIVLISSFNCGPDSMANEMIIRKIKDKPILNLIIDGQEGIGGIETRLESFMDIILFKKEGGLFDR
jgi:predicted nucleotide-binding protein (sugar kinase/HSP70/actin superfamily)